MKLIEKKCPNCGASLEFNEKDKSCTCNYCHRAFEIERDNANDDEEKYILNEVVAKSVFSPLFIIIPFLIVIVFIIISFNIFKFMKSDNKPLNKGTDSTIVENNQKDDEEEIEGEPEEELLTNVNELTSQNLQAINTQAIFEIKDAKGENGYPHSFLVEDRIRNKVYVAYKEGTNYLIAIFEVKYKDFYHQSDIQAIFVPLKYENVEKDYVSLYDAKIDAPEYYFDKDKTTYAYGYTSFDEAYNNIIKPLESDYTITEK